MAEVPANWPPIGTAPPDLQTTAEPPDLQAVYQAHIRAVYAFIYARVGNQAAAEDVTSDVFLKALTHLDPTRDAHSVAAWLFRVARHAVADYWRAGHAAVLIPFAEGRATHHLVPPLQSTACRHEQTAARAHALLAQLPAHYRTVLTCRLLEGLSVAETAQQMGTSAANVKVMQHRALKCAAALAEDDGHG